MDPRVGGAQIFDLMGFEPSHWNKINIHVGGVYGDKKSTIDRFAANFRRLSPNLRARLTLENDDTPSGYSISDLLPLHEATGIPLVFDFHHYKFCPGGFCQQVVPWWVVPTSSALVGFATKFCHVGLCLLLSRGLLSCLSREMRGVWRRRGLGWTRRRERGGGRAGRARESQREGEGEEGRERDGGSGREGENNCGQVRLMRQNPNQGNRWRGRGDGVPSCHGL